MEETETWECLLKLAVGYMKLANEYKSIPEKHEYFETKFQEYYMESEIISGHIENPFYESKKS